MNFSECMDRGGKVLMEGALGERLKREYGLLFDEYVAMAGLVYTQEGRSALKELWNGYIAIAKKYRVPFLATTPTRRANRERVEKSSFDASIIRDNVAFLRSVQKDSGCTMYVGGLMGCKGDAYTGEGALSEKEAFRFHSWQAELFAQSGADFLMAGIMPTLPEAAGMARAMGAVNLPYIISFTIQKDGRLIDGTTILDAIRYIDSVTTQQPVCYMTNCVHPSIVYEALSQSFNDNPIVRERFKGIQANTSPLSYAELDGSLDLKCSDPEDLAYAMKRLTGKGNFQIFGGCCGTDCRHMEAIVKEIVL